MPKQMEKRSITLKDRPGITIRAVAEGQIEIEYECEPINYTLITDAVESQTKNLSRQMQGIAIDAAIAAVHDVHAFVMFQELQR